VPIADAVRLGDNARTGSNNGDFGNGVHEGMKKNTTRIFSLGWLLCRCSALLLALVVSSNAYSSCAAPANDIERENCLPGSPSAEWDIPTFDKGDITIQGFATDISVNRGSTVRFKVKTPATAWRLDIYRLGYYGGDGARKVATVNPSVQLPQTQPPCFTDSTTGLTDCGNWAVSASWAVPANAVSGIYLAKAIRTDTGGSSHIVFIVRNDASHSDILFQVADTSWQAYNTYSANFYGCDEDFNSACRAFKVSYNRPFWTRSFEPETWLFGGEFPMVMWLEANGYDVTYFTDTDTDRSGSLLLNHKVWMSNGHDEYWSAAQRANVEAARAAGVNLAFFSSNSIYWKTRWETSIDGSGTPYRTLVCYKETWFNAPTADPAPSTWTGTWRDPRFSPPKDGGRPENALMGTLTRIASKYYGSITVPQSDGRLRFWRNTEIANLAPGQTYTLPAATLGAEVQADEDNGFRPAGLFRLSSTVINSDGHLLDYGNTTGVGTITHALTLYRHSSGALVFSSGTYNWSWGLDSSHDNSHLGIETDVNMRQATVNLLADMGVQPRTLQPGLVPANASTDQTAPQSVITSLAPGSSIAVGVPVTLAGTATDSGGGLVAGVEISTDGGVAWHPANGRGSWTYTFTPKIAGPISLLSRAVDDSGNLESPPSARPVNITGTSYWTLWPTEGTPSGILDAGADSPLALGVKFRTDQSGFITGIRFHKAPTNTGPHTGTLWTSAGVPLATATFTNESASGWQQAIFATPVAISANTVYVASYHTSVGHYSIDKQYFAGNGITSGPLNALGTTASGSNGVFAYGASTTFPNATFAATNYWVDVLFTTTAPPPPTLSSISVSPTGQTILTGTTLQLTALGNYSNLSTQNLSSQAAWNSSNSSVASVSSSGLVTALSPGSTTISATLNGVTGSATLTVQLGPLTIVTASLAGGLQNLPYSTAVAATGGIAPYTWALTGGALPAGLSLSASTGAISGTPTALGNFSFTIRASDSSNPAKTTSKAFGINIVAPASSIWGASTVPTTVDAGGDNPVELGVKFFSDASGYITGARFYKASTNTGTHVASLWTSTGTLLATATFTAETASGWQEVSFPAPVLIAANTIYVVSYHTNVGHYSYGLDYFVGQSADNPPLHFPADGIAGPNGVFAYGANSTFPTNSFRASNYWVDAVYSAVSPPTAPLAIVTASVPAGVAGLAYSTPLAGSGGALPYSWSLSAGALPAGLTLNPNTGAISGTPTELGNSSFTVRISDSSNPPRVASRTLSINIGSPASSVWDDSAVPETLDGGPDSPVELGAKFTSDMSGYITGARFYKASTNRGTHVANLWTGAGTRLATATFTAETASGWQQVSFPAPVPITANTVYVISYHTDVGHYSSTSGYFSGRSAENPPLRMLASGMAGSNGVYTYSATSAFPTSSFGDSNYWVDVVFSPTPPPSAPLTITTTTLPDGAATVPYSAILSGAGGTAPFAWSISSGALPSGLSIDANTGAISGTPTALGPYDFTIRLTDASAPVQAVTRSMSIDIGSTISSTVWPVTVVPAVPDAGPDSPVELGVQFRADVNGHVAGVRFYKSSANTGTHTAHLWSSTGTLLATATFTNETPSGWQQANFPTPVAVTANTTYVVSYHTDVGHYSATPSYFGGVGVDNPPLHVPAGGGVYGYGPGSVFPSNTFNGTNYWVDVVFTRP
jgi:hypothetical protein